MNPEFWRGRRVFLTGHTGFKGSWLSIWLQRLGAEVTGFSLAPATDPNLFQMAKVAGGMHSVIGDIRSAERLKDVLLEAAPEVVIHMAAQPLVRPSYDDPVETFSTNVMGTVHLLDAVRQSQSVRAVLNVTTDKCYENNEWEWGYREADRLGGYDPYSNSKACSELVTASFRSSFFNPESHDVHGVAVATARAGNVVGGGDYSKDRLIPDLLAAFRDGEAALIRSPNAVRPWQHVLEPLRGYLMLAERLHNAGPNWGEAWNFGPEGGQERSVMWVAQELACRWGAGAQWEIEAGALLHEARLLKLDISKARARLGWQPKLSASETLDLVVAWERGRLDGSDARSLVEQQIADYVPIA